ncbi:glycosyltransferase family 9 protein [Hydrogenothermus marinus]|uniref:ADP-heptose:LPS heptosyltransferase n=1 Tax=Hydrogenothermus marinus TaxID=133270 RepID=A0A3M0BEY0_9AQUI|nr:glycosyltransferase family 9 protein [Hydrogenothermus marinus]RMA93135.1 ADP-heptose:LPS heptosyltransferase [Hydrogenothermus marinus]
MKIAVIRFSSLGDVALSSVVLQPLYEKGYKITFITFKPFDTLFEKDYRIEKLVGLNKKDLKTVKDIKSFSKSLKDFDLILDLHSNLRTFLISFFSGIKTLRYNKKSLQRRLLIKPFLKNFVNLQNFNVLKAYLKPLENLNIKGDYKPKLILDEKDFPNIEIPENFIAIGTGARYKGKIYPYFKQVIENLNENIVLVGSKEDLEKDKNEYKNVLDLRGKLSLRQSLAVLSKAKLTISNDSAIAHLSRSVGTKVIMIYGATHPYFGFYPLEDEGSFLFADLKCQPCDLHGKKECKYKDYRCFKAITPEMVLKEVKKYV